MKPVDSHFQLLLLALCASFVVGCSSTPRSVAFYPKGGSPAFTYRNDLGYQGPGPSRALWDKRMGSFLFFDHEQPGGPAAYIVFLHLKGPQEQKDIRYRDGRTGEILTLPEARTYASAPSIFLDGRAITDDCITYLESMKDANAADPGFLRIRPGEHHLRASVELRSYDARIDRGEWEDSPDEYIAPTEPFDHVISLRAGDAYMVVTGVLGGISHDGDAIRTGIRTTLLPRDKMIPDVAWGGVPTPEEVLAATQERAAQGDPAAQFDLGERYLLAIGVPPDTARGKELIRRAADAGHVPALQKMANIEELVPRGTPFFDEYESRTRRVAEWHGEAFERGSRSSGERLLQYYRKRPKSEEMQAKIVQLEARLQTMPELEPKGISQDAVVEEVRALATASRPEPSVDDEELAAISREIAAEWRAHAQARLKYSQGDYEGAVAVCDEVLAATPDSSLLLMARADALLQLFRYEEALASYQAAGRHVVIFGDHEPARAVWHGQGLALLRLGRFEEAEQAVRTALDHKDDATSRFVLANVLSSRGDLDAAIIELDRAVELAPDYGSAYGTRAVYRARLGDKDGALADYREVEERAPHILPVVSMGLRSLGVDLPE